MPGFCLICSGQGAQDAAMVERLLAYPGAGPLLARIRSSGVLPGGALAWLDRPGDAGDLIFRNDIAQPMVCLYQMLAWEAVKTLLPAPGIFMGYSLGELSACGCAGVFKPAEAVRLAAARGRLMSGAAVIPQTMAAVLGLDGEQLKGICARFKAQVAIINAADHHVVGLPLEALPAFIAECSKSGAARVVRLPVAVAAHTFHMREAARAFEKALLAAEFNPGGNVIAGVSGEKVFSRERMISALAGQVDCAIDWRACMESAISYGCRVFLELGPGNSLARMALSEFQGIEARAIPEFRDLRAVGRWVEAAMGRI